MVKYSHFIFDGAVVKAYDAFNHWASLGLDLLWRRRTARILADQYSNGPVNVLDLACGSGDMAIAMKRTNPAYFVVGSDPSAEMLHIFKLKADKDMNTVRAVTFLPFRAGTFSAITCAFGFRNFVHLRQNLILLAFLLKSGGRIYALDFYQPGNLFTRILLTVYQRTVFPVLGFILSGQLSSYRYLYKSIHKFLTPGQFMRLLQETGFTCVEKYSMFFGLVHLIIAEKV
ncbi:ubiquinone/menaquinone biosynthesis methyltransferase [candidate division KSB1 bacterium]|nr:ubiquinone/menaquinone biosynthesis methyltransferase [candidate division KSB1 bacterium]